MADQIVQNQIGFAPEIAPFAQNLLGMAQGQAFTYQRDAQGNVVKDAQGLPIPTGFQQQPTYQQYAQQQGISPERVAQFTPLQQQAFAGAGQLGYNPYSVGAASGLAGLAQQAGNYGYQGQQYGNAYQNPLQYQPAQFQAREVRAPQMQNYQMQAPANVQAQRVAAERVSAPQLQALQMQAAGNVGTQTFGQPSAEQYMSPYMQSVVNIQQREAQRAANIAKTTAQAQAARAGAYGGSRQALMAAEAARNLALQKGDIQAAGLQSAYAQAQQQFNAEQQARLQAALANQGVQQQANLQNLSAGLQTQGLGAQTGLQAQQLNQQTGLQAQQLNQQTGLQANLANQQMGYNVGNTNLQAMLQQQQLGSGQNMQAQLANQQYGLSAQQMQEQARQYGYGQQMAGAQNMAQYGQAANQLNAQQAQFGAGLGLQGMQAGMQGYQNLGAQGQNLYNQNVGNIGLQGQFGTQQQQNVQNVMTNTYQDYLTQANQPYKQMGFLSDLYRGAPLSQQGSTMYQSPPTMLNQVAGLGTAAFGAAKAFGSKKGGVIKDKAKSAGLAELLVHKMA